MIDQSCNTVVYLRRCPKKGSDRYGELRRFHFTSLLSGEAPLVVGPPAIRPPPISPGQQRKQSERDEMTRSFHSRFRTFSVSLCNKYIIRNVAHVTRLPKSKPTKHCNRRKSGPISWSYLPICFQLDARRDYFCSMVIMDHCSVKDIWEMLVHCCQAWNSGYLFLKMLKLFIEDRSDQRSKTFEV
jgi:hypothetical protein